MKQDILGDLAALIRERRNSDADKSYTRSLLDGGVEKCAKKLGEEASETMIAALVQPDDDLRAEAADLLYHLLVLLESRMVDFDSVLEVLAARQGISGHEEKASRQKG